MVAVRRGASRYQQMGGEGGRVVRQSLVPHVVERLMYDNYATLVVVFMRRSLPGQGMWSGQPGLAWHDCHLPVLNTDQGVYGVHK